MDWRLIDNGLASDWDGLTPDWHRIGIGLALDWLLIDTGLTLD